jgi:hypothetical protein
MNTEDRISHIGKALTALQPGFPFLVMEIDERITELTEQLVNNDNEQTRGRIKALRWVKELPEALSNERQGLAAALPETDAAD